MTKIMALSERKEKRVQMWSMHLLSFAFSVVMLTTLPAIAADTSIASVLKRTESMVVKQFYEPRGYEPAWVTDSGLSPQGKQLVDVMQQASGASPQSQQAWEMFEKQMTNGTISPQQLGNIERMLTEQASQLLNSQGGTSNSLNDMLASMTNRENMRPWIDQLERQLANGGFTMDGLSNSIAEQLNVPAIQSNWQQQAKEWISRVSNNVKAAVQKLKTQLQGAT